MFLKCEQNTNQNKGLGMSDIFVRDGELQIDIAKNFMTDLWNNKKTHQNRVTRILLKSDKFILTERQKYYLFL